MYVVTVESYQNNRLSAIGILTYIGVLMQNGALYFVATRSTLNKTLLYLFSDFNFSIVSAITCCHCWFYLDIFALIDIIQNRHNPFTPRMDSTPDGQNLKSTHPK